MSFVLCFGDLKVPSVRIEKLFIVHFYRTDIKLSAFYIFPFFFVQHTSQIYKVVYKLIKNQFKTNRCFISTILLKFEIGFHN